MFTTDLVNLYNRNIFKTSLYIYIFQDEKCRLMRNLSLSDKTWQLVNRIKYLLPNIVKSFDTKENNEKYHMTLIL